MRRAEQRADRAGDLEAATRGVADQAHVGDAAALVPLLAGLGPVSTETDLSESMEAPAPSASLA